MSLGHFTFDPEHPYLKSQLIAYIGNKRALQGFLAGVFERLGRERGVFLDPFAGSGAVSRLARYLGFRVLANDQEFYAYVLNFAHLCAGRSEAERLFPALGGPQHLLAMLNALPDPPETEQYIARHYAPADTEKADYRTERLFYTRENALRIDAARNRIEELCPGFELEPERKKEKLLLLASLLYQSATHTNTSGVFKACHKGFGGHGRDALKRIMAPIRLEMPELLDAQQDAEVYCEDAAAFARRFSGDICYLDPPYNQHQYGSNYHLLNTIALWDRPAVSEERRAGGRLRHKAGIRPDWVQTRSEFCSRKTALSALEELLAAVDARYIVLSYNTEGIIPFEGLLAAMEKRGALRLFTSDYVKYRGGKQSIDRQVHTLEFVLVTDRRRRASPRQQEEIRRLVLLNKLRLLLRRSFQPAQVARVFGLPAAERATSAAQVSVQLDGHTVALPMPHLYQIDPGAQAELSRACSPELEELYARLSACECRDRGEEIEVLVGLLDRNGDERQRVQWQRRILWLLKKFAHRKYREQFEAAVSRLQALASHDQSRYAQLAKGLQSIVPLARARFNG